MDTRIKPLNRGRARTAGHRDIGAVDARGNVVFARLGNGVEVFASHHADSGQLQSLEAYDSAGRELQDAEYLFDVLAICNSA